MVVLVKCTDSGWVISSVSHEEGVKLYNNCIRNVRHPDGFIDWVVFLQGYEGYLMLGDSSRGSADSDSTSDSFGRNSDCILLYCVTGVTPRFPKQRNKEYIIRVINKRACHTAFQNLLNRK